MQMTLAPLLAKDNVKPISALTGILLVNAVTLILTGLFQTHVVVSGIALVVFIGSYFLSSFVIFKETTYRRGQEPYVVLLFAVVALLWILLATFYLSVMRPFAGNFIGAFGFSLGMWTTVGAIPLDPATPVDRAWGLSLSFVGMVHNVAFLALLLLKKPERSK